MRFFKSLPLSLILLIADYTTPTEGNLIPRAIHKAHKFAAKKTHNLARDLRVAFGGVLVSRDDTSAATTKRVVYCKPKQAPFGTGPTNSGTNTGGGNGTSVSVAGSPTQGYPSASGTKTATGSKPSATANIPDSPWKLQQSYVRDLFFYISCSARVEWTLMVGYSLEIASSKGGTSSRAAILLMVCTLLIPFIARQ